MKTPARTQFSLCLMTAFAAASLGAATAQAQSPTITRGVTTAKDAAPAATTPHAVASGAPARIVSGTDFSSIGPSLDLSTGKSTLIRFPSAIERISLGNPVVADVTLISPLELYVLAKAYGSTNMIVWRKGGGATAIDINVSIDSDRMQKKLLEILPNEKGIKVRAAADSVILTGMVSSAVKSKQAEEIANAYVRDVNKNLVLPIVAGDNKASSGTTLRITSGGGGGGARDATSAAGAQVVNLLQVAEAQQVMLEVTVAEVSKTLLDNLGASFRAVGQNGNWGFNLLSNLSGSGAGLLSAIKNSNNSGIQLDAQKDDGLIKVLAEPNIVAISGQEGSFLAGGKVFIPVARANETTGGSTITLEEKEFGVGLKFTPTVLEGGRIHLKVAPEVSELSQTGTPFTTVGGATAILPSLTTRKVQTSVQLMDGQSFAIAGLIKNNIKEAVNRIPGLGEVPIMGALFRSSQFQGDRTELLFVITPRLVKPLDQNYILPTDSFIPPSRSEFFLGNKLEGTGRPDFPLDKRSAPAPMPGGLEVK